MPVTVKIAEKKSKEDMPAPADLADFESPGERSDGTKAFLIWMLLMVVLCAIVSSIMWEVGTGIFAWWVLSSLVYFMIAPRTLQRRLRMHGNEAKLTSKTQPRLKNTLSKGSSLLSVDEPESFMLAEEASQIRILGSSKPYYVIVTQGALQYLQPAEIDCLVIRSLVQSRLGHVRRMSVLRFLNDTPAAVRLLAWPVNFYGVLLRHWWQDQAEQSADRLTLLLVKNHELMKSAIIKQHAVSDPQMQEQNITTEDVDNYVRQGNIIGMQGNEISTQYKLGQAIHGNSYLEDRLNALDAWARSPEYKEALEKLAAARAPRTPL